MVIDCHGHYTTVSKSVQAFRDAQVAALASGAPRPTPDIRVSDDEIREALQEPIQAIVDALKHALEQTPPELAADISATLATPAMQAKLNEVGSTKIELSGRELAEVVERDTRKWAEVIRFAGLRPQR